MDRIVCLIGASGSGKTTLAKELEKEGYNIIHSYTDREPREPNEWGHTFVSKEDIPMSENIIAYQVIYGNRYYSLRHQYQGKGTSIYVIDPKGAEQVRNNVKNAEVMSVYLQSDKKIRRKRMVNSRKVPLVTDRLRKDFEIFKKVKCDYVVDANRSMKDVKDLVLEILEK